MKFIRKALTALVATFAFATTAVAQTVGSPSTVPIGAPNIPTTDFNVGAALVRSGIPVSAGNDPLGAFRFICSAGQVNYDDPIVFPGQSGTSHLHQYYGNTSVNSSTSFSSLRSHGGSTCNYVDGTHSANRTGYWMPAMLLGNQYVLQPDYVAIYYKRLPLNNPGCQPLSVPGGQGQCVAIPNGLKMIFGYDMVTNTIPTGAGQFLCLHGSQAVSGVYGNLADLAKAGDCPVGDEIDARINAPICWDGKNLDSPNHRSHVSYMVVDRFTAVGRCPTDHPYLMPRFTMTVVYQMTPAVHDAYAALAAEARTGAAWDYTKILHLASDEMRPTLKPGTTFHGDYFEGWDDAVKTMWTNGCINSHLNCSGGNMGNGEGLKGASVPVYNGFANWMNPSPLLPIPAKPASAMAMSMMRM